ncbi:MAG TPA: rod shape-determining protein MreC [Thiothrix sp.]|nr:rod shape-determining protein MreC [Thiothrix sp.]
MLFAILSLIIMVADYRQHKTQDLHTALSILTYPFQVIVDLPSKVTASLGSFFATHKTLARENKDYREKIQFYSAQQKMFLSIREDNEALRRQLNAKDKIYNKFSMSDILNIATDNFRHEATINSGEHDKVFIGQPVLTEGYIYGQIIQIAPFTSTVMQLTDTNHAIPVRNTRNGMRALAVGTGKVNTLELEAIAANADIRKGDTFVSSGLGRLFPADYPVAKVTDVEYEPGDPFVTVSATTFTNYNMSRQVLLVWDTSKAKVAKLNAASEEKDKEASSDASDQKDDKKEKGSEGKKKNEEAN